MSERIMGDMNDVKLTVCGDNKFMLSMRVLPPKSIFINKELCATSYECCIFQIRWIIRSNNSTPKFTPNVPRELKQYFKELKMLFALAQVIDNMEKKKHAY
jgi:hypothetical protein